MGFCHAAIPDLLPWGYHGPLVVALDSNILIDLQQYGGALLNDELPTVDKAYRADLAGLADLLNLWLLRDIRFVVTPRSLTDARRVTDRFLDRQTRAVDAIAQSLAFQLGDWSELPPSHGHSPRLLGDETNLPYGADRDLILEAQAVGAHIFMTRDRRVLRRVSLSGPVLKVIPPSELADILVQAGCRPITGGTCGSDECPYDNWMMPAPDVGKWGPLLSLFE